MPPVEGPKEFVIYLELPPKAKERARRSKSGGMFTPQKTRAYQQHLGYLAKCQFIFQPIKGPICCDVTFYFHRPKRPKHPIYHVTKPDRDNLDKAVLDALQGICWFNDCQIADGRIRKLYAIDGKAPGIELRFKEMK